MYSDGSHHSDSEFYYPNEESSISIIINTSTEESRGPVIIVEWDSLTDHLLNTLYVSSMKTRLSNSSNYVYKIQYFM